MSHACPNRDTSSAWLHACAAPQLLPALQICAETIEDYKTKHRKRLLILRDKLAALPAGVATRMTIACVRSATTQSPDTFRKVHAKVQDDFHRTDRVLRLDAGIEHMQSARGSRDWDTLKQMLVLRFSEAFEQRMEAFGEEVRLDPPSPPPCPTAPSDGSRHRPNYPVVLPHACRSAFLLPPKHTHLFGRPVALLQFLIVRTHGWRRSVLCRSLLIAAAWTHHCRSRWPCMSATCSCECRRL